MGHSQIKIDESALRNTDHDEKYRAKEREDAKRRAREPRVSVGDKVVVFKTIRSKGEPKYGQEPFEIISMYRGDCVIESADGRILKRNISHLKRLTPDIWEDITLPENVNPVKENQNASQKPQVISSSVESSPRPTRQRKEPDRLIIQSLENIGD